MSKLAFGCVADPNWPAPCEYDDEDLYHVYDEGIKMKNKILLWILDKRVGWGNPIIKPFDRWLYNHID
jgi:hypothetical protein